jgi:protein-S-isoprenylcysteine O-methyltransferase Ste14
MVNVILLAGVFLFFSVFYFDKATRTDEPKYEMVSNILLIVFIISILVGASLS